MIHLKARSKYFVLHLRSLAVIIIIGIIVAVATHQEPIQDPDAITLGPLNSNEETCDEQPDSKQNQTYT